MQIIYQANADDLNEEFLDSVKAAFKHKEIEIVVYERDETAYLLRSPANRARLLEAARGRCFGLVSKATSSAST